MNGNKKMWAEMGCKHVFPQIMYRFPSTRMIKVGICLFSHVCVKVAVFCPYKVTQSLRAVHQQRAPQPLRWLFLRFPKPNQAEALRGLKV